MLAAAVAAILDRDLQALAREVAAYPDERALWETPPGITNSAGTLALHLAGNVRHYLGAQLGGTGYVRDRPAEFASRNVPRRTILAQIDEARAAVRAAAARTGADREEQDFPEVVGGVRVATGEYLIHLVSHFTFHLGQVDYHRRVVTGQTQGVDAVRAAELSTARPVAD
ncbi:MAG TPA: DUF664 domain-containing protein [Gemmatimonadales bacterium]|jgi:uncharacterized damage-inducible protein DinB